MEETADVTPEILTDFDDPFYARPKSSTRQSFSLPELNDLDLGLSKNAAQI